MQPIIPADFEPNTQPIIEAPACTAPKCFVGSYAPITKGGQDGPFFVNTYLLQPNRQLETVGAVPVRAKDFKCN
jgi:hypothetical protein